MASSSVSQESLDREDYEVVARRSRVRALRARIVPHKTESLETTDDKDQDDMDDGLEAGDTLAPQFPPFGGNACGPGMMDHESPTRLAGRLKEKRGRPNHLHKGKTVKDKRKLREKRRSTGVVHIASTEVRDNTGDSLDEDDKETDETRRNTACNEVIDADNPQTPEEERKSYASRSVRNKSPSDLDADLEDNQDYDSTVSQSETNLTTIGQSSSLPSNATKFRLRSSPPSGSKAGPAAALPHGIAEHPPATRPLSYPSRFHETFCGPGGGKASHSGPWLNHDRSDFSNNSDSAGAGGAVVAPRTLVEGRKATVSFSTDSAPMDSRLLAKTVELEKMLDIEREEKRKMQELLDERDKKIAQLERNLALLNRDKENMEEENEHLLLENEALTSALSTVEDHLTTV